MIRWIEGECRLEAQLIGPSEESLYCEAIAGFSRLVGICGEATCDRMPVRLEHSERPLIAALLDDLLVLAETEGFAAIRLERLRLEGDGLRAAVSGLTGGVTPRFRGVDSASIVCSGEMWRATVVFT